MKITGPGTGVPADVADIADGATEAIGPSGKDFSQVKGDKDAARGVAAATPAGASAAVGAIDAARLVADIGADLTAGRITPELAVERVINRIVDQQLGVDAPAAVREKVGAVMRDALESDPLLLAKLQNLGRG